MGKSMAEPTYDVLTVLPTDRDRTALEDAGDRYRLHWMDDEAYAYPYPDPEFDMVAYTERCAEYVDDHGIDAILYSHDYSNMVAGVLNDRYDLLGPGLEPIFLTNHKYYSRAHQPTAMWWDYIDLATREWGDLEPRFPCYVKPAMMTMTLLQHKVETPDELTEALDLISTETQALQKINTRFLERYLDIGRYDLATEDIVVVEEPIEDWTQHCVEGWVEPDANIHVWAISNHHYYPGDRLAIDHYATPSTVATDKQLAMVEMATETVRNHGLATGFWNVEIWDLGDRFEVTEINGRSATVWDDLYRGTFDTSVYDAMLALHCGDTDRVRSLAPDWSPGDEFDRVGGQFHVVTFGEGSAESLFDFEFTRSVDATDIDVLVTEDDVVEQTRTSGEWLARFQLYGEDYDSIVRRADELRAGMLKRPEESPQPDRVSPES